MAVLASGNGSNFQAIADAVADGRLTARIEVLVVNSAAAKAIERARQRAIPVEIIDSKKITDAKIFEAALLRVLEERGVELVVLAGFMKILGPGILKRFPQRIVNIHPSLLPAFPGLRAIQRALESGERQTGVTVHFVDEGVDTGPIIAQTVVPILAGDSLEGLEARLHLEEHRLYPKVLQWFAEKRISLINGQVSLRP